MPLTTRKLVRITINHVRIKTDLRKDDFGTLFSFVPVRIRTGIGVPLKALGPVESGDSRFYITAGTSF